MWTLWSVVWRVYFFQFTIKADKSRIICDLLYNQRGGGRGNVVVSAWCSYVEVASICYVRVSYVNGGSRERSDSTTEWIKNTKLLAQWGTSWVTWLSGFNGFNALCVVCIGQSVTRTIRSIGRRPPPGGRKTCSKTRIEFCVRFVGVSFHLNQRQLNPEFKHSSGSSSGTPPVPVLSTFKIKLWLSCEYTYI